MKKQTYAITYEGKDCSPPLIGAHSLRDAATTAVEVCRTASGNPIPDSVGNFGVESPSGATTYYWVRRPRLTRTSRFNRDGTVVRFRTPEVG